MQAGTHFAPTSKSQIIIKVSFILNNKLQRGLSHFWSSWRPFGPRSNSRQKYPDMKAEVLIWPIFKSQIMVKPSSKFENNSKKDFSKVSRSFEVIWTHFPCIDLPCPTKDCLSDMGLQLVFCGTFSNYNSLKLHGIAATAPSAYKYTPWATF